MLLAFQAINTTYLHRYFSVGLFKTNFTLKCYQIVKHFYRSNTNKYTLFNLHHYDISLVFLVSISCQSILL